MEEGIPLSRGVAGCRLSGSVSLPLLPLISLLAAQLIRSDTIAEAKYEIAEVS